MTWSNSEMNSTTRSRSSMNRKKEMQSRRKKCKKLKAAFGSNKWTREVRTKRPYEKWTRFQIRAQSGRLRHQRGAIKRKLRLSSKTKTWRTPLTSRSKRSSGCASKAEKETCQLAKKWSRQIWLRAPVNSKLRLLKGTKLPNNCVTFGLSNRFRKRQHMLLRMCSNETSQRWW